MEILTFASVSFLALFPIVNPLGAIPLFFSLTRNLSQPELHQTERKIAIYVTLILLVFMVAGPAVLEFFGISIGVLKIAGGLIVANTAWTMATGASRITVDEKQLATEKQDISFTPMAMPMLSGPGSIGVVMGLGATAQSVWHFVGLGLGVLGVGLIVFIILRSSEPLSSRLGQGTIGALNRIFGFLILAIAVQLCWNGILDLRDGHSF